MTGGAPPIRVGLTLPSFQSDPEKVLAVARAAEDAGLDGVFLFDHLFRARGDAPDAERRPALELMTMMSAVAAATSRVAVGTLVARATLRPPALLRTGLDTLARIAPGRIIAGLGAGDDESLAENLAFGIESPDLAPEELAAYRLERLGATATELAGRNYPVWVAARTPAARRIAAHADGWNHWGSDVKAFATATGQMQAEVADAGRDPAAFTCTWGGLAVLAPTAAEAGEKWDRLGGGRTGIIHGTPPEVADQISAYAEAGAAWVILGPIDSANSANAALLGEARLRLRSVPG